MDIQSKMAERQELLVRLQNEYRDNLIPAMIGEKNNKDDMDEPVILSVLLDELGSGRDEAYMECCFRPFTSEDDEVQYFVSVITFSDDLSSEYLPALIEAVSYINAQIPSGSFYVDMSHSFLCFRLSAPLPVSMEGSLLYSEMNTVTGAAVSIADAYYDLLLEVSEGESTIEDVIEFLGG